MLVRAVARAAYSSFAAVFAPSRFVRLETPGVASSWTTAVPQLARAVTVWVANLVLYAVPLTLSGIGLTTRERAPSWFTAAVGPLGASPDRTWQLLVGTVSNSVFLIVATGLVFVTFHATVAVADWSRRERYLQSLSTIAYTTSVYLAGLFTVVMYISTADGFEGAERFLLGLQARFIQGTIDFFGVPMTTQWAGVGSTRLDGLTPRGELLLGSVAVLTMYFLYSMYLGARLNHGLNRRESGLVVVGVLVAPVAYIAGSGLVTVLLDSYGIGALSAAISVTLG
jgi:hypothetical protein